MTADPEAAGQSLEIRDLSKSFGELQVLHDISVSAAAGEFLVLVGPSGCGKSTLLNCIAGLEEATSGAVLIGGRDVTEAPPKDRDIAMVFQSYALYPTMSVAQNMGFGMTVRRAPKAEIDAKVGKAAELLQIAPLLDRKPSQLSGGQRQRVAMGRALVRDPALFLFDEPLSNLDAKLRVEMRAEIKHLHQRTGATIVYVTHDQIEAMTLATQIVVLKDGHVQQVGTPEQIYDRPANAFVADFMGAPPMNLVPAQIGGGQIRFAPEQSLPRPEACPASDGPILLGVRPELMQITAPASDAIPVTIGLVEMTGADSYVSFALGEARVTARTPGRFALPEGAQAGLRLDPQSLHYFDHASQKRLG